MDWRWWLWWVLASTVGWAVGGTVGVALGRGLAMGIVVTGYVGMAAGVIAAGGLQWLVLRRQVAGMAWWIVASVVGAALVGILAAVLGWVAGVVGRLVGGAAWGANWGPDWSADPGGDVGFVVAVAVGGTVLGVLHWLVLRRQVARAGWWVLASPYRGLGRVVAASCLGSRTLTRGLGRARGLGRGRLRVWDHDPHESLLNRPAGWAVLGAVYAAITGIVLVWLLRRPAAGTAAVTAAA